LRQSLQKQEERLQQSEERILQAEERLSRSQEKVDRKVDELERRDRQVVQRERQSERLHREAEELKQSQQAELERVASLTEDQARGIILQRVESQTRDDAARLMRQIETEAKDEADKRARKIIGMAIQRLASEYVAEITAGRWEAIAAAAADAEAALDQGDMPLKGKSIVHEINRVFGDNTILVKENGGQDLWAYFWPYYQVLDPGCCVPPAEQTASPERVTATVPP